MTPPVPCSTGTVIALPTSLDGCGHGDAVAALVGAGDVSKKSPERLAVSKPTPVSLDGEARLVGPDFDTTVETLDDGVPWLIVEASHAEDPEYGLAQGDQVVDELVHRGAAR
jgi:hypothetical protein